MSSREPSSSEPADSAPKPKPPAKKTARPAPSKIGSGTASKTTRPAPAKSGSSAAAAKAAKAAKAAQARPAKGAPARPANKAGPVRPESAAPGVSDEKAREVSAEPVLEAEPVSPVTPRPIGIKLLLSMGRPRATRGQIVVALLCGLLGFALVTQVHSQAGTGLSSARQADLVDVLDNLSAKSDQLRSQITDEQNTLSKLTGGAGQNQAALEEAQQRASTLQILAGTVGVTGPGIDLRITDPDRKITADVLLDTLEELRDAGAEAVAIRGSAPAPSGSAVTPSGSAVTPSGSAVTPSGSAPGSAAGPAPGSALAVRLVASSYFVDSLDGQGVVVDGTLLAPPYDMLAIGDAPTLSQAMGIPGGVLDTLKGKGARGAVTQSASIRITALHAVTPPKYARPAASAGS